MIDNMETGKRIKEYGFEKIKKTRGMRTGSSGSSRIEINVPSSVDDFLHPDGVDDLASSKSGN